MNPSKKFQTTTTGSHNLWGLPSTLGMVGSIAFFLTLFGLANPDQSGYEQIRKCHRNCMNGLLHFGGMPIAVSGVFLIMRGVSDSAEFTRHLSIGVASAFLYLYLRYETNAYSPWLFYFLYTSVFEFILYRRIYRDPTWNRLAYVLVGILVVATTVGSMEVIGHGIFEHHHSYVSEFFNSVFHTPLYGVNSALNLVAPQTNHTCW